MLRCIELGKKGLGTVAPNPMVGCVIVHKGHIIGEGFTSPYGGPHAEVNAISSVRDISLLAHATLYVTLEPCSHFGKTPPCSDLILEHKIPEVIIGLLDPHDKVAGKGIEKLRKNGCNVTVGVLEHACREHHKRFLSLHEKKRPYIILKWAETLDGFIAPAQDMRKKSPEPFWITNPWSKQLVHKWRSEEHAILVGTKTILEDNPKLTVRNWEGKHPIRIVIDQNLKVPEGFHVLDASAKTIVFTQVNDASYFLDGIDYHIIDFSQPIAKQICSVLGKLSISSLIVEGGAKTLQTFMEESLWDEAKVFQGPKVFQRGIEAPKVSGHLVETTKIKSDKLSIYTND